MIGIQSTVLTFSVLGAYYYGLSLNNIGMEQYILMGGEKAAEMLEIPRTYAFATMISAELLRAFTTRSEMYSVFRIGLFSNKFMNIGVGFSFFLLFMALYGPLHVIFRTFEPTLHDWMIIGGFAILPFIAGEFGKMFLDVTGSKIHHNK